MFNLRCFSLGPPGAKGDVGRTGDQGPVGPEGLQGNKGLHPSGHSCWRVYWFSLTKYICFANNPFTNEQICSPTLSLGKINGIPGILREWCFVKLKRLKYGNWIRLAMMSRVFTECNSVKAGWLPFQSPSQPEWREKLLPVAAVTLDDVNDVIFRTLRQLIFKRCLRFFEIFSFS